MHDHAAGLTPALIGGQFAFDPKRTFDLVLCGRVATEELSYPPSLTAYGEKSSHPVKGLDLDPTEHRPIFIRNFDRVCWEIMHRAGIGSS